MFPFRSSIFVVLIAIACTMATPVLSHSTEAAPTGKITFEDDRETPFPTSEPAPEQNTSFLGRVWNGFWGFFTNQGSLFVKENVKEFKTELSKEFGKGLGSDLGKKASGSIGGFFTQAKESLDMALFSLKGIEGFKKHYGLIRILPENTPEHTAKRMKAEIKRNKFIHTYDEPTIEEKATELLYNKRTMDRIGSMIINIIDELLPDSKKRSKGLMTHILYGNPGTGKTELAERIINMIPSSSINDVVMYKTTGQQIMTYHGKVFKQLLQVMKQSKKKTILLIDEIDPIFEAINNRGTYTRKDFEDVVLNKFGSPSENYVIIGTTNKPYIEDKRIRQRFKIEYVDLPSNKTRVKFFEQMYYKGMCDRNRIFPDFELFDTFLSLIHEKFTIEELYNRIKEDDPNYKFELLTSLINTDQKSDNDEDIQDREYSIIELTNGMAGRDFIKVGQQYLARLKSILRKKKKKQQKENQNDTLVDLDSIRLTSEDLSHNDLVLDILDIVFTEQRIAIFKQEKKLEDEKEHLKNENAIKAALLKHEKEAEKKENIKNLEEDLKEVIKTGDQQRIRELEHAIYLLKN